VDTHTMMTMGGGRVVEVGAPRGAELVQNLDHFCLRITGSNIVHF